MENNYQCYHPKPALVFDSEKGISSSHTCIIIVIVKYQNISPSVKNASGTQLISKGIQFGFIGLWS